MSSSNLESNSFRIKVVRLVIRREDWFHVTMRLTVMGQISEGLRMSAER